MMEKQVLIPGVYSEHTEPVPVLGLCNRECGRLVSGTTLWFSVMYNGQLHLVPQPCLVCIHKSNGYDLYISPKDHKA